MLVQKLKLTCFRNYESIIFVPEPKSNLIMGDNGAGKTNLLEALFMCAFLRSHRTSRDSELIKFSAPNAYIAMTFTCQTGEHEISMSIKEGERKQVFIDKNKPERLGDAIGMFSTVMFSPEDMSIVKGGPAERRRFMDMELSSLSSKYFFALQRYTSALKQRNKLLKNSAQLYRPGILEPWDELLAENGAALYKERARFCERLNAKAATIDGMLSGDRERLNVRYLPFVNADTQDGIMSALRHARNDDIRRGTTTIGPHRDDIALTVNDMDAKSYCSQGQQRSVAIALKLAMLKIIEELKEPPILLLDDVFSELDLERREALLSAIEGCQCFITSTEDYVLDRAIELEGVSVFMCRRGELVRAD